MITELSRYKKINIVIEKDEYGYYAYCPELPGCQSQGDTFEEVTANIREAAELYLETLIENIILKFSNFSLTYKEKQQTE